MNARDRIAKAMFARTVLLDDTDILWETLSERRRAVWLQNADAVLAVLPGLLTDPDVIATAAEATDTAHVRTGRILAAAAEALTGGAS